MFTMYVYVFNVDFRLNFVKIRLHFVQIEDIYQSKSIPCQNNELKHSLYLNNYKIYTELARNKNLSKNNIAIWCRNYRNLKTYLKLYSRYECFQFVEISNPIHMYTNYSQLKHTSKNYSLRVRSCLQIYKRIGVTAFPLCSNVLKIIQKNIFNRIKIFSSCLYFVVYKINHSFLSDHIKLVVQST